MILEQLLEIAPLSSLQGFVQIQVASFGSALFELGRLGIV